MDYDSELESFSSDAVVDGMESKSSEEIFNGENASIGATESMGNGDEEILTGRPKRGRKRKVPSQSRADRKRMYNNNQTHINTKGNIVHAKKFDEHFVCGCREKCTRNVSMELRKRLFNQYWSMGNFAGRCVLLLDCIEKNPSETRKKYSIYGQRVCKVALMRTLQINECRSRVSLHKYKNCDTFADGRGQTTGGKRKLSSARKKEILRHISSFPKYVSHYTRSQTESKFLSTSLNLAKIYRLYARKSQNPVRKSTYKKIFYKYFNLRFKPPKKDTCKKCDIFKNRVKDADNILTRHILENWHDNHLKLAESLQTQMKTDLKEAANDPELECASFDMEKILVWPKLPTSIVYYLRQLNLYNLGIHTGSTGKGLFNVWNETQASKGTQEVGSCLKKYISNLLKPASRLILWADSCGGQNRSIRLVLMLIHILQQHSTLKTISLRFLESGHTFLPNDTEFSDVECALKRKKRIYTDEQYIRIMKNCRVNNKFEVKKMLPEDFFSVKKIEELITNRKMDINKEKINWMETHEIVLDKLHPTMIKMRRQLTDPFQTVNISKADGTVPDWAELDQLWPDGRPLSKAKLDDLKELLTLVPNKYKDSFSFLGVVPVGDFEDDIDGYGAEIDFEPEL